MRIKPSTRYSQSCPPLLILILDNKQATALSIDEIRVYLFLATNGPHKKSEISSSLDLDNRKIDGILNELLDLEIVRLLPGDQTFWVLPFKELIDLFIEVKREQAKNVKENKETLLSIWKTLLKKNH